MKPLLVGESNPYGSDPRFALYPDPPRCAGWNLCHKIMQINARDYCERFDRVNLCAGKWSMREARERARELLQMEREFVLCGAKVAKAVGITFEPFTRGRLILGNLHARQVVILPHPSGLSRAWNEPGAYERARSVLREAGVL